MARITIVSAVILILLIPAIAARAQQDPLQGRWEGTVQSIQGERAARAIIKKEGDAYTGTITGIRGDIAVKELKLEGETVTAKSQIDTPQGSIAGAHFHIGKLKVVNSSIKNSTEVQRLYQLFGCRRKQRQVVGLDNGFLEIGVNVYFTDKLAELFLSVKGKDDGI